MLNPAKIVRRRERAAASTAKRPAEARDAVASVGEVSNASSASETGPVSSASASLYEDSEAGETEHGEVVASGGSRNPSEKKSDSSSAGAEGYQNMTNREIEDELELIELRKKEIGLRAELARRERLN